MMSFISVRHYWNVGSKATWTWWTLWWHFSAQNLHKGICIKLVFFSLDVLPELLGQKRLSLLRNLQAIAHCSVQMVKYSMLSLLQHSLNKCARKGMIRDLWAKTRKCRAGESQCNREGREGKREKWKRGRCIMWQRKLCIVPVLVLTRDISKVTGVLKLAAATKKKEVCQITFFLW